MTKAVNTYVKMLGVVVAPMATVVLLLSACGPETLPWDSAPTTTTSTVSEAEVDAWMDSVKDAPRCDQLAGKPTDQIGNDIDVCWSDDDALATLATTSMKCPDGRTLAWNDYGWGHLGDTWAAADATGLPPAAELDRCTT